MSLYMLGKVIGKDRSHLQGVLASIAAFNEVEIAVDQLAVEDKEGIEESEYLRGPGLFFTVSNTHGGAATKLWIDAMSEVRKHVEPDSCDTEQLPSGVLADFLATRLGRISSSLLSSGTAAGIALVDGGIEQVFVASRSACLRRMVCDVARPWDQSPNRLYVCRSTTD